MIELTGYDGYRVLDKVSVMVSRIVQVSEMMGNTSLVFLEVGGGKPQQLRVLESRDRVQGLINAYLEAHP